MSRRPSPTHRCVTVALAVLALWGCGPDRSPTDHVAIVVRVVDGDTVVVRIGRAVETVRLIGIDTPETVKPDAPVECHGPEASAAAAELLAVGTRVRLTRDVEPRDDYGRLLAYVHRLADGLFVNLELAAVGAARPLSIPPNTAAGDDIAAAVRTARAGRLGLWATCSR
jgi:micrococcal nuclease